MEVCLAMTVLGASIHEHKPDTSICCSKKYVGLAGWMLSAGLSDGSDTNIEQTLCHLLSKHGGWHAEPSGQHIFSDKPQAQNSIKIREPAWLHLSPPDHATRMTLAIASVHKDPRHKTYCCVRTTPSGIRSLHANCTFIRLNEGKRCKNDHVGNKAVVEQTVYNQLCICAFLYFVAIMLSGLLLELLRYDNKASH